MLRSAFRRLGGASLEAGCALGSIRSASSLPQAFYSTLPLLSARAPALEYPGMLFSLQQAWTVRSFSMDASMDVNPKDKDRADRLADYQNEEDEDEEEEIQAGTRLTHRPRQAEEFERAKLQWSQVMTAEDHALLAEGSVQNAALEAGKQVSKIGVLPALAYIVPPRELFAVVECNSHQFKVTTDDVIYTEKLKNVTVNDKVIIPHVLMLGSKHETVIGRPYVPGAAVVAVVEQQTRDAKVIIFKKKRRKNYTRSKGHRQELTMLRILDIVGIEE